MNPHLNRRRACAGLLASAVLPAWAQGDRPVTLVVPTSPGGSTDAIGRIVAEMLPALTGRAMLVNNRPGAGGSIGAAHVAKAPADGSVLLLNTSGQAINPVAMRKLPYDVERDFVGIGGLGQSPLIIVAHAQFEGQTARDIKALFARSPDKVSFAVGDMATRLATEQAMSALGIKATVVQYKGTGPAMTDVGGGHVPLAITTLGAAMPLIRGGQVKPVALLSAARLKQLPDVPTLTEQGFAAESVGWWALSAPAGLPASQVVRLGADLQRLVKSPQFEARLEGLFMTPWPIGPAEFDSFFAAEVRRMAAVASAAGIQPE